MSQVRGVPTKVLEFAHGGVDYRFKLRSTPFTAAADIWTDGHRWDYLNLLGFTNTEDPALLKGAKALARVDHYLIEGPPITDKPQDRLQYIGNLPPPVLRLIRDEYNKQFVDLPTIDVGGFVVRPEQFTGFDELWVEGQKWQYLQMAQVESYAFDLDVITKCKALATLDLVVQQGIAPNTNRVTALLSMTPTMINQIKDRYWDQFKGGEFEDPKVF